MKFIADVNIAQFLIKQLRQDGHSVIDIKKEELNNKTERELLKALTIITESGFEIYPYPPDL